MRTIHNERNCRLRCFRPEKLNLRPRSTASLAERYSFDLVRRWPLARSNIFLRLARRLVPRFTRGMVFLLFAFYVLAAGGKDDRLAANLWPLHAPSYVVRPPPAAFGS